MLVLRMYKISTVLRTFFGIPPVFSISHRGVFSKKSQRDVRVLYGKLLETQPQRRKRLESKNFEISSSNSKKEYKYWEIDFLIKHSKKDTVRILSHEKNKEQASKNKEKESKKSKTKPEKKSTDSENLDLIGVKGENSVDLSNSKVESNQLEYPNFTKEELKRESQHQNSSEKINDIKNENVGRQVSKIVGPSEIIVKNMKSFSIYDSMKSARIAHNKMSVSSEIISISATEDKSNSNLPSVTRILSATMSESSKKALAIWKEQMIQKLGREGFDVYQKDLFQDGHDLHSSIENTLLQKEYEIPERVKPAFQSVENVLKDISGVSALESHVVHPKLLYRGITDCVATYRGELCLIDWKKSDKRKDTISSIYDAPTQVASYIGALNADMRYPFEIKKGVVVVAYTSGEEATVHELVEEDLYIYWKAWLRRLQKYFVESKK